MEYIFFNDELFERLKKFAKNTFSQDELDDWNESELINQFIARNLEAVGY